MSDAIKNDDRAAVEHYGKKMRADIEGLQADRSSC